MPEEAQAPRRRVAKSLARALRFLSPTVAPRVIYRYIRLHSHRSAWPMTTSSLRSTCLRSLVSDEISRTRSPLTLWSFSVYKIPPKTSAGGHKASDWKDQVWAGKLQVVTKGKECLIKLIGDGGKLFGELAPQAPQWRALSTLKPCSATLSTATAPIRKGGPPAVEKVRVVYVSHREAIARTRVKPLYLLRRCPTAAATSRSALRTPRVSSASLSTSIRGNCSGGSRAPSPAPCSAFIGVGFNQRSDAFDFNVALQEWQKCVQRGAGSGGGGPTLRPCSCLQGGRARGGGCGSAARADGPDRGLHAQGGSDLHDQGRDRRLQGQTHYRRRRACPRVAWRGRRATGAAAGGRGPSEAAPAPGELRRHRSRRGRRAGPQACWSCLSRCCPRRSSCIGPER